MYKKLTMILALIAAVVLTIPSVVSVELQLGDASPISKEPAAGDSKQNGSNPILNARIEIINPRKNWIHVLGIPVVPYVKTIILGAGSLYIKGYAENINLLECIIEDLNGRQVYREGKNNFGTGYFSFKWSSKRGQYKITVWEGLGAFPSAMDTVNVIIT